MQWLNESGQKPKIISQEIIDRNKLPPYLDGNNYVFIDKRMCSLPNFANKLSKFGFNLYTVYKLRAVCNTNLGEMALIAHSNSPILGQDLCIGVPFAYIKPRDISKNNLFFYLAKCYFCPWCNSNNMAASKKLIVCKDDKHCFTLKQHNKMLKANLHVYDMFELHQEITNQGISLITNYHIYNDYSITKQKLVNQADKLKALLPFV